MVICPCSKHLARVINEYLGPLNDYDDTIKVEINFTNKEAEERFKIIFTEEVLSSHEKILDEIGRPN